MYIQPISNLHAKIKRVQDKLKNAFEKWLCEHNMKEVNYKISQSFKKYNEVFYKCWSDKTIYKENDTYKDPNVLVYKITISFWKLKTEVSFCLNKNFVGDFEFTTHFWDNLKYHLKNKMHVNDSQNCLNHSPFKYFVNEKYWVMWGTIKVLWDWVYVQDFSYGVINQPLTIIKWKLYVNTVDWDFLDGVNISSSTKDKYNIWLILRNLGECFKEGLVIVQSNWTILYKSKTKDYLFQDLDEVVKTHENFALFEDVIAYKGEIYDISKEDHKFIKENLWNKNLKVIHENLFSLDETEFICHKWCCFKVNKEFMQWKIGDLSKKCIYRLQNKWFYQLYLHSLVENGNILIDRIQNKTLKALSEDWYLSICNGDFKSNDYFLIHTDKWEEGIFYKPHPNTYNGYLRFVYNEETKKYKVDLVNLEENWKIRIVLTLIEAKTDNKSILSNDKPLDFLSLEEEHDGGFDIYQFKCQLFKLPLFFSSFPKYRVYPSEINHLFMTLFDGWNRNRKFDNLIFKLNNRLYLWWEKIICGDKILDLKHKNKIKNEVLEHHLYYNPKHLWFKPNWEGAFYNLKTTKKEEKIINALWKSIWAIKKKILPSCFLSILFTLFSYGEMVRVKLK